MRNWLNFSKIDSLALIFILLINLLLKIPITNKGFFAFTYDQGRDLLAVSKIIYEGTLTLIGPTTGLQGIFYGPWWYYFLSPLLFISGGNPQSVGSLFGLLGIATVVCLYLFIKNTTHSLLLSLSLALVASMSSSWMFGPTLIWNTSLTPILLIFFIVLMNKIFDEPKSVYFFLLGIVAFLIMDSELPFGLIILGYVLISILIFRKVFFQKKILLTFSGMLLILLPRILFDLRHNFLISKSIISYLIHPKIYGEEVPLITRFIYRLDLYWGIFSQAFTRNNKLLGLLFFFLIVSIIFLISKNKKVWHDLKNDVLFIHLSLIIIFSLIFFTLFKDVVWDYYLIGLPVLFILIISRIFLCATRLKKAKLFTAGVLLILVVLNFNKGILSPFKIFWEGDGATYKNEKMVIDYIASQKPRDYSFYAYSPAIFDYPFDYWYNRQGLLENPKDNQKLMYLVIREESSQKYHKLGWYGDKTKDSTVVLERKEFPGDLIIEKHQFIN